MIDAGNVRIRVRDVQDAAAAVFAIPRAALGAGYGPYVRERQLAMALAVDLTGKSLVDIAAVFGCDHTTIRHASIRVRGRLRDDPALRAKADRIRTEAAISAARFIETMRRAALPQANQGRSAEMSKRELRDQIHAQVRALAEKGLQRTVIAQRLGLTRGAVSHILNGRRRPATTLEAE